jgi:hypothetical protein
MGWKYNADWTPMTGENLIVYFSLIITIWSALTFFNIYLFPPGQRISAACNCESRMAIAFQIVGIPF